MAEQTKAKKAERSKWGEAHDAYRAAKNAILRACQAGEAEDDARFQHLYEPFGDALTRMMFEPADSPNAIAAKLRAWADEDMVDWRTGHAAFEMIISDLNYFSVHGCQPDCG